MTNSETSSDVVQKAAESYLSSLDNEVSHTKIEELEYEIEEGENRRQRLIEEHGEDHNLVQKAGEVVDKKKERLQEFEEIQEEVGTARKEILRKIVDNFELNVQWMDEFVIEAVNHSLYGQRDSSYKLYGEEFSSTEDLTDLNPFDKINRAEVVILLARDALGESKEVAEQFDRLENSKSFAAFEVLGEEGSLTSEQVAEKLDEDKSTVNNWLKNPINLWDRLIPFYRPAKGEYGLSTTGRYLYTAFYFAEEEEDSSRGAEARETDSIDGIQLQSTLGESGEGDEEDQESERGEDVNISEIEDTEEKAEAMFSNVSNQLDS